MHKKIEEIDPLTGKVVEVNGIVQYEKDLNGKDK